MYVCRNVCKVKVVYDTCFLQLVPESPRYLILNGKEEKAKKVLALIAWVNCKQPLSGRLVTQEEKESLLEERNRLSSPANELAETSLMESEDSSGEMHSDPKIMERYQMLKKMDT